MECSKIRASNNVFIKNINAADLFHNLRLRGRFDFHPQSLNRTSSTYAARKGSQAKFNWNQTVYSEGGNKTRINQNHFVEYYSPHQRCCGILSAQPADQRCLIVEKA